MLDEIVEGVESWWPPTAVGERNNDDALAESISLTLRLEASLVGGYHV